MIKNMSTRSLNLLTSFLAHLPVWTYKYRIVQVTFNRAAIELGNRGEWFSVSER